MHNAAYDFNDDILGLGASFWDRLAGQWFEQEKKTDRALPGGRRERRGRTHVDEGKLRVLAVTGPRRLPNMPQVATLAELGYPEANLTSLFGFYAPAAMPPEAVRRLNADINEREHAANARIVKEANIKAE